MRRLLGYLWASPNSLLGLLAAALGLLSAGRWRVVRGVLEVEGPALAWLLGRAASVTGGIEAMTLGHVVLGRDANCLARCREHELVHVRQYERWGPLFLPAYFLASGWAWLRGGDAYRDNCFEREAFGED